MSNQDVLSIILSSIQGLKQDVAAMRDKNTDQIGKLHRRIDEMQKENQSRLEDITEKHHKFEVQVKENDTRIENRIGWVATAAAVIMGIGVEVVKYIISQIKG